jgi:hypothetical protein
LLVTASLKGRIARSSLSTSPGIRLSASESLRPPTCGPQCPVEYHRSPGIRRRKLTESDLIREAIAAYLGRADQEPAPEQAVLEPELAPAEPMPLPIPIDPVDGELQRVRLQLPAFLIAGMTERARQLEMRPAAWLAALMQFNLTRVPVLATAELFGLREATRELRAVGHNINQLTRLANEAALIGGQHAAPELSALQALSAQIDQLREQVRATVRASQGVWRTAE